MITTIENLKEIRDISNNLKDGRILPYIKEVEDAYILPTIGADLYERLDNGEEEDAILLNGGYYEIDTPDGKKKEKCFGIRLAVAYYAYSKVLRNNMVNVTAFGITEKQTSLSNPSDNHDIDDAVAQARTMGEYYLKSVVRYLGKDKKPCCDKKPHGYSGSHLKMEVIR